MSPLDIGNSLLDIGPFLVHVIIHPQPPLPPLLRIIQKIIRCTRSINAGMVSVKGIYELEINKKVITQIDPGRKIPSNKFL